MKKFEKELESLCVYAQNIVFLCGMIIFGLFSFVVWSSFSEEKQEQVEMKIIPWCGTPDRRGSSPKGKELFVNNCVQCHAKNMDFDLTGPALSGVTVRWEKYPKADLRNWIRNSQAMIRKKHPMAKKIWRKWNKSVMPSLEHLTDIEIDEILKYIGN